MFTSLVIGRGTFGIWFYSTRICGSLGLCFTAFIAWILFFVLIALQWYIPLQSMFDGGFKKTLKKCFILLIDNLCFSIFNAIYLVILALISLFFAFLIPGELGRAHV